MTNLITVEEYKLHNDITSSKQDDRYQGLIDATTEIINNYLGFDIAASQTTEKIITISDRYDYYLESMDTEVSEVLYKRRGEPKVSLSEDDYLVDNTGRLTLLIPFKIRDNDVLTVTYGSAPKALNDIKLATIMLARFYDKEEYNKEAVTSMGTSIEYTSSKGIPSHVKALLDLHRVI